MYEGARLLELRAVGGVEEANLDRRRGRDTVSVAIPLNLTRLSGAGLAMQSCPELEQRPRY